MAKGQVCPVGPEPDRRLDAEINVFPKPMKLAKKTISWTSRPALATAVLAILSVWSARAADYPTTILADNPRAYFRLEETSGTTAVDSSSTGSFPGTYVTSGAFPILGQPGIKTNSISLSSGQAASVTAGYYPELNQPGPFSFEIWARPVSVPTGGNYRCPIGNSPAFGTATQSGWYIYQTSFSIMVFLCNFQ